MNTKKHYCSQCRQEVPANGHRDCNPSGAALVSQKVEDAIEKAAKELADGRDLQYVNFIYFAKRVISEALASVTQDKEEQPLHTELSSFLTAIINSGKDFILPNGSRLQHAATNFLEALEEPRAESGPRDVQGPMEWKVIDTPCRPKRWKVESVQWPGRNNSWTEYFEDRYAAELECSRRNSKTHEQGLSSGISDAATASKEIANQARQLAIKIAHLPFRDGTGSVFYQGASQEDHAYEVILPALTAERERADKAEEIVKELRKLWERRANTWAGMQEPVWSGKDVAREIRLCSKQLAAALASTAEAHKDSVA